MTETNQKKKVDKRIKKFEDGMQRISKIHKSMDKNPCSEGMKRNEHNAKVAYQLLRRTVMVKKLSWLEEIIKEKPDFKFKGIIAIYIYFNKSEKVSEVFYPNLYRIMNEFEQAVIKARDNDPYFEVFKVYEYRRNKKSSYEFLMEARKYMKDMLDESGISINQLSEYTGIKYANLYNFLIKEQSGKIKLDKVHRALWLLYGLKEGWPVEKAILKHKEKMKSLWLHWRVDIDDK